MKIKFSIRTYTLFYVFLLLTGLNCKKESTSGNTPISPAPVFVGQSNMGGIVAYIFQSGDAGYVAGETHGLIAASTDLDSLLVWGCEDTLIVGANDTTIGSGRQNTTDIMDGCISTNIAARVCNFSDIKGYSDWYLPSKQELDKLYINRFLIGGFDVNSGAYWSSSEYNRKTGWMQNFKTGTQGNDYKSIKSHVRPIRTF